MEKQPQNGFTLIELLIALAIAAILLGVGVPSFVDAIKSSRVSSDYNEIVGALYLARSEAAKTGSNITVCPRKVPDSEECGTAWKNGVIIFQDDTPVSTGTTAEVGTGDVILGYADELLSDAKIRSFGRTTLGASTDNVNYIRYQSNGQTNWAGSSFEFCDDRGDDRSRAVNIVLTGDVRRGRASGSSKVPTDVFNKEVCQ